MHNVDISYMLLGILNKLQQLMNVSMSNYDEFFISVFSSN